MRKAGGFGMKNRLLFLFVKGQLLKWVGPSFEKRVGRLAVRGAKKSKAGFWGLHKLVRLTAGENLTPS